MSSRKGLVNKLPPYVVFWGGSGQAKVNRPIVEHFKSKVLAVFDDTPNLVSPFSDVPIYHGWDEFMKWISRRKRSQIGFCVSIGNPHGRVRLKLHERLQGEGLSPVSIAHPTAFIAKNATIGEGAQIMAGAIVQSEAEIGRQCIINTKACIDHECVLKDGVEIAPGATLCGNVTVGTNGWVCAGAVIVPRTRIGSDAIVGAGSVVTKDVPNAAVVYGVPARVVRFRKVD